MRNRPRELQTTDAGRAGPRAASDGSVTRRRALELGAGVLATAAFGPELLAGRTPASPGGTRADEAPAMQTDIILKRIARSGEEIPAVGLGTWQTFDVGSDRAQRTDLADVLRSFHRMGGRVVDSSPMYGSSQEVLGDLAVQTGLIGDLWVATKVWTNGRERGMRQMEDSMSLLRRPSHIELMQVHNLRDVEVHLDTLQAWKRDGRFDYVGITTSSERQYDDVARLMEAEPDRVDFLQINYSLGEREADRRVLPMARERGIAVMVNRPFAGGRLFRAVRGQDLPGWASSFGCEAWSQLFLKYVISHPAVTCAIPATSDPEHLVENMGALRGALPDEDTRREMEGLVR